MRRIPILRAACAAGLIAATTGVAAAQSTDLLWSLQGNGDLECITACPDIDGDGGPDIVFEGYGNGPSGVDHVFAIRGASSGAGEVIWSTRPIGGASSGGGYGDNCLRLGPDLSGDGFPDLLLGTAWGGRTAYALNGLSGATLWSFDTYLTANSGWVYAMDSLGSDLTGDGVPEIVFCCGSDNDRIYCVNGATGALVWSYYGQDAAMDIRSCEDIDNDGIRDVVAGLGDNAVPRQVIALSGATGAVRWSRPTNGSIWNLIFVSDLNGDGVREIVPALWTGTLMCIDGRTGAIAWSVSAPQQQRVAALEDIDGDGRLDILVGFNTTAGARAYSGATGALLWAAPTSDWAWAVDRVDDCTGDGVNDAVAGDFDGWVYLFDGVTGALQWSWRNPTADKVMTVRGVPDLNGNGRPDVVAGTQLLYGGTGGDIYALEGNTDAATVPAAQPFVAAWLSPARPNPARGAVHWDLRAPEDAALRLMIVGPDGRSVADLGRPRAGAAGVQWDGRDVHGRPVPTGVYHARLLSGGRALAESRVVQIR